MKDKNVFCRKTWSPYVCGAILGVISAASLALAHQRLGATGGFATIAAFLVKAFGLTDVFGIYFTAVKPALFNPDVLLVLGMALGAFVAARLTGPIKPSTLPESGWKERFGTSAAKRWVMVFIGCMLLAIGAGIAGGCTSGMGVSGTMQLSRSGLAFIISCFTAGIAWASILYRGQ